MADERAGTRDLETRKKPSWMELLRTFLIALDPFKLLLAAVGILATAVGWWLISAIFYGAWTEPKGLTDERAREADINERKEYYKGKEKSDEQAYNLAVQDRNREVNRYKLMSEIAGPGGRFQVMPWFEQRGRNPYLTVSGAVEGTDGNRSAVSAVASEGYVLIEPLRKFLDPILLLFDARSNFWVQVYLLLLLLWLLVVWGLFGGVITRMAVVQMAGKEGGGLRESVKFVRARYLSYLSSPIVPVLLIFAVVLGCIVFGLFHLIPLFGDIVVDGLFWWIPLGAGFVMALLVVGLVGYPLMYTTLSAEGSDTFDALSRSYNYVYESPWSYIWYGLVSIVYGAVVVFFVVFMTSLMVYLGKWGVSRTPLTQTFNRSPDYLFIYSPTSFGWRELLLKGSPVEVTRDPAKVQEGKFEEQTAGLYYVRPEEANAYMREYSWYNKAGAGMVSFWLTLLFMLMLGFSYSYFWTASSMIYLLMRKKVDEVEIDEIYTEEEDFEEPVPPKSPTASPAAPTSIPVDAPTLRVAPTTPVTPPTVPSSESSPSTPSSPTSGSLPDSPTAEKSEKPPEPPTNAKP